MKRLLLLLTAIGVVAVSCQKDIAYNDMSEKETSIEVKKSSYAVSEEKALSRLESELAAIKGVETRASNRSVRTIKPIKFNDIAPATRSSDIDVDNLLYIVEFEDGQGSAILGADERVEPIYAILDESSLSSEDFYNAANGINKEHLKTYLATAIIDEAVEQLSISRGSIIIPPISELQYSYFEYDTITNESKEMLLNTKWHQSAPYNNGCYNEDGDKCVAGCVTINVAQVLLYNSIKNNLQLTVGSENFNKTLLNMRRYGYSIPAALVDSVNSEVARYVAKLADELDIELGIFESTGSTSDIVDVMIDSGYAEAEYIESDSLSFEDEVREQLFIRGLPAPFRGEDADETGHSWVIDGYLYQRAKEYIVTVEGNVIIRREYCRLVTNRKIHCNFGWGGMCDGYYTYGIFDVSSELGTDEIVPEVGDRPSSLEDYVFNNELEMVMYRL